MESFSVGFLQVFRKKGVFLSDSCSISAKNDKVCEKAGQKTEKMAKNGTG